MTIINKGGRPPGQPDAANLLSREMRDTIKLLGDARQIIAKQLDVLDTRLLQEGTSIADMISISEAIINISAALTKTIETIGKYTMDRRVRSESAPETAPADKSVEDILKEFTR